MIIILPPFAKFDLNNIVLDYCQWLKSLVCSANYVESSTFKLVYKVHFDVNRPLVYEWGACLVSRVPLNLYFNISLNIQLHNYLIICCRFKVTSTCKGEGGIWCDDNTVPLRQV